LSSAPLASPADHPMAAEPLLELRHINKGFPGVAALTDVSLELYPGEVHCLMGENGAGKSTLIKVLAGAYRPDSGEIFFKGVLAPPSNPKWARDNGISAIYQEVDLVPDLTVAENIFLGRERISTAGFLSGKKMRQEAQTLLAEAGLEVSPDAVLRNLKLAHQQEVAVAKALALNATVMIFDEPTASFTTAEVDRLFALIRRLREAGMAILYISHHLDEIFAVGDRITVLRDGHRVTSGPIEEFTHDRLVQLMVGRGVDLSASWVPGVRGEEALRVVDLRRAGVLNGVSFALHRGEIVGVAGLVGAGRTETARVIVGADRPDSGQIFVHGRARKVSAPYRAAALGIGMVPEDRKGEGLVLHRSVAENSAYAYVQLRSRFGLVPWRKVRTLARGILQQLQIRPANPRNAVGLLSGGNQQKVVLARWLAADSDILILDEPTRGVDVGARSELYELMQRLKRDGKAILMISSDLQEILTQSDRVLVLAKGRIVGELSHEEATDERILHLALDLPPDPAPEDA